ncbi:MAG TPA: gephyrin-like molybdotransferase Glp [Bryobacteraceae bacterium]|jgi:molybdopterin molybdotransferase|nr:gephyrin-like molybdotransferase Glp [Bryobacteraceae bacterium]
MRGFAQRHTVEAALAWLDAQLQPLDAEDVPLRLAAGRVLARPVTSDIDVPGFDRATMDGYALTADSTEGASPYSPLTLEVIGDSMPGSPFGGLVSAGQSVRVMTGAPIPRGADAVLPAEWVEAVEAESDSRSIRALAAVSPGKNVGRRGEDINRGTALLEQGRVLRPQDLGVLSSIGQGEAHVFRRPRVRLVVTGNELLPSGTRPDGFHIADANGPMLAALIERDGGLVDFPGLVRDDRNAILEGMQADADLVIVTGGSSVGIEDLAPMLVAQYGELAVHGIAMRPSSPTGLGRMQNRLIFLLPGNPVSSLCAYDFFAGRAIRALGGRTKSWPYRAIRGTLNRKISSPIGRLDYARVKIADGLVEPLTIAGASLLSSTTRADGFVIIDDDSEGFAAGAEVEVWLYA